MWRSQITSATRPENVSYVSRGDAAHTALQFVQRCKAAESERLCQCINAGDANHGEGGQVERNGIVQQQLVHLDSGAR